MGSTLGRQSTGKMHRRETAVGSQGDRLMQRPSFRSVLAANDSLTPISVHDGLGTQLIRA